MILACRFPRRVDLPERVAQQAVSLHLEPHHHQDLLLDLARVRDWQDIKTIMTMQHDRHHHPDQILHLRGNWELARILSIPRHSLSSSLPIHMRSRIQDQHLNELRRPIIFHPVRRPSRLKELHPHLPRHSSMHDLLLLREERRRLLDHLSLVKTPPARDNQQRMPREWLNQAKLRDPTFTRPRRPLRLLKQVKSLPMQLNQVLASPSLVDQPLLDRFNQPKRRNRALHRHLRVGRLLHQLMKSPKQRLSKSGSVP